MDRFVRLVNKMGAAKWSKTGTTFWTKFSIRDPMEAEISWRWFRAVHARARERGRQLLRINCDETNVMRGLKNAKGLVVRKLQHGPPQLLEEASELKGSLTHLVFVCDDAEQACRASCLR